MLLHNRSLGLLVLILLTTKNLASDSYLLPWAIKGLGAEAISQEELHEATKVILQKCCEGKGEPLAQGETNTHLRVALKDFFKIRLSKKASGVLIKPKLCGLGNLFTVSLWVVRFEDTFQGRLYHNILPIKVLKNREMLKNGIESVVAQSLAKPLQASFPLKVNINFGNENSRPDQGSYTCLSDSLLEQLSAESMSFEGREIKENIETLNRSFAKNPEMAANLIADRKANLAVTVYWYPENPLEPLNLSKALHMDFTGAEAIFAKQTMEHQRLKMDALIENNRLSWRNIKPLQEWLQKEITLRDPNIKPKIVKINKAWAYLDKGRSWGLELDDRLVSLSDKGIVKGHVIGFYGPDSNLKNAGGVKISDGAIVFVRKGQRQLKIGMNFDFDKTSYPTPWPPVASKP